MKFNYQIKSMLLDFMEISVITLKDLAYLLVMKLIHKRRLFMILLSKRKLFNLRKKLLKFKYKKKSH